MDRHCTLLDILLLVDTWLLVDNLLDVVTKTPPVAAKAVPALGHVQLAMNSLDDFHCTLVDIQLLIRYWAAG